MKIVVAGTGAFGTALANRFQSKIVRRKQTEHTLIMYGIDKHEVEDINHNHKNKKYYSKPLNAALRATTSPKEAFEDADIIVLAVPSFAFRTLVEKTITPFLTKPAYFIHVAKGLDGITNKTLSESLKEIIPAELNRGIMKLSGPSFAMELMAKQPTFFSLACEDLEAADVVAEIFQSNFIHIQTTKELLGVEWASVLKNPYAVLMGVINGLGYKVNTKAFFFTKMMQEMDGFLKALDVPWEIGFTPAAMGDLFLTASSKKSRNFSTGNKIGKADKVTSKILQSFVTVEGLKSIEKIINFAKAHKIRVDLLDLLYNITYNKEIPSKTVERYFEDYKNKR